MNFDKAPEAKPEAPAEIIVTPQEFKVNALGNEYETEENGVFYGGDYLSKPPAEIDLNFPPAPPHEEHPAL